MGIPVLFMLGILALWAVASGRATNFITAITGGQSSNTNAFGQPTSGPITNPGQQFPGVAYDNQTPIGQGMPSTFYGFNPNAYAMTPPYVMSDN